MASTHVMSEAILFFHGAIAAAALFFSPERSGSSHVMPMAALHVG